MKKHLEVTTMATMTRPQPRAASSRPLLGLRRRPGRLALLVFRLPLPLYRAGWGRLFLGHTFLVLTHVGRKTGKPYATAAMVLAEDETTGEVVICSVWGPHADWIRNLHAHPALRVQIGRTSFVPQHRFLTDEEAVAVGAEFRHRHPWRVRLISRVLGVDLRSDAGIREFIDTRPFVALRPAAPSAGVEAGTESADSAAEGLTAKGDEQPCVRCT
jgi:deazaflavin-dependent oxidoreductase (nitroreductase family)